MITFADNTAAPNTTYSYVVGAFTASHSSESDSATVTTPDGIILGAETFKQKGTLHVNLSWTGGSSFGQKIIWRQIDGKGFTPLATVEQSDGESYTDPTGLKSGHLLDYVICNSEGTTCSEVIPLTS
jgi:hypothetical protein